MQSVAVLNRLIRAPLAAAVIAFVVLGAAGSAGAGVPCDLVASPSGSDAAVGSVAAPFSSAQKLVDSLQPGQVGCLRGGTYVEDVRFGRGGQIGAPVTLTAFPGETATVVGRMWVARGADHVTVTGLHLDGRNSDVLPSPTINANDVNFSDDDVTNGHTGICFDVGSGTYGSAEGTVISHDRIHGCGVLPASNHDHGIYVASATDTLIEWNLIYDNADRGVQLYPDAQGTVIDHNVIDGNGEGIIFSGDYGYASSDSDVYDNLLTNSKVRHDAESFWGSGPVGTNNRLHDNCLWGGAEGPIDQSGGGFSVSDNLIADPGYVDAAHGNYALRPGSACAAILYGAQAYQARDRVPAQPSRPRLAPRQKPRLFNWLHARLIRRGRRQLLAVTGRPGRLLSARPHAILILQARVRGRWHRLAVLRTTADHQFRLLHGIGPATAIRVWALLPQPLATVVRLKRAARNR